MSRRAVGKSPTGATVGAGGGITALSDPDEELAEVKLKAAALLGISRKSLWEKLRMYDLEEVETAPQGLSMPAERVAARLPPLPT